MSDLSSNTRKHAWVIPFYAFKGGTGRTLALANVARWLAETGYRVGCVDLDVDAPGLPHEPLCKELEPGHPDTRSVREAIDAKRGFIGALEGVAIQECVQPLSVSGSGALFLMPAIEQSASRKKTYLAELPGYHRLYARLGEQGLLDSTARIARQFADAYRLDYILIDARTGVSPTFAASVIGISHALVLLTGLTDQSIEGTMSVLARTAEKEDEANVPVFLVASPVPTVGLTSLDDRLAALRKKLDDLRSRRGSLAFATPSDVHFMFPYVDVAAFNETYFLGAHPDSSLAGEYRRLAQEIESLVARTSDARHTIAVTTKDPLAESLLTLGSAGKPLRIAAENISLDPLEDFLTEELNLTPMPLRAQRGLMERVEFELDGGAGVPVVALELWSATNENAPWGSSFAKDPTPPDIVLVPQSHLRVLASQLRDNLIIDESRWSSTDVERPLIFDRRFLDRTYPGWRTWCTDRGHVLAFPFSTNATVLCGNREKLRTLCALYWRENGHGHEHGPLFFPSNWHLMLDLLHMAGASPEPVAGEVFRFATEGRALYYEWLNVVLAFGGADLDLGEGNVASDAHSPSIGTEETLVGTQFFLRLLRASINEDAYLSNVGMDDLVTQFRSGKLHSYVGWTDSFRFDDNYRAFPARVTARNDSNDVSVDTWLSRIPRDVRRSRRPLVAPWVATVPRQTDSGRDHVSFTMLDRLLSPPSQRRMLWAGFPSASRIIVAEELEHARDTVSGTEHRADYVVFLQTLQDALSTGHLVPALADTHAYIEQVCGNLRELATMRSGLSTTVDEIRRRLNNLSGLLKKQYQISLQVTATGSPVTPLGGQNP